ncbi:MAG: hypothetical protein NZ929_07515, partial [Aigarchaeota archaeon]|nr:hypothetical protein [Aigarchaeota archaeon]
SSAGAIALSVFSSILGETGLKAPDKIKIQLKDKRYLIIHNYSDRFLICITRPNPRLGFIELVLEYYKRDLLGSTSMERCIISTIKE